MKVISMARLLTVLVMSLPMLAVGQPASDRRDPEAIPPGPTMPIVREMQCQSEVCLPGIHMACRSLDLLAAPGIGERSIATLSRGDEFRVVAARTIVLTPGVVRLTRDVTEIFGRSVDYRQGEYLFLLDYRGEGWYSAWRDGEIAAIEQFWPDSRFGAPAGFEYGGELLRQAETQIWLGVEREGQNEAWVHQVPGAMIGPREISIARAMRGNDPLDSCFD